MVERIVEFFSPYFSNWGYLIVGAATLLENSVGLGIVVPGETLVLVGGFYSSPEVGSLSPAGIAAVAFAGGVVGDSLGYLIGRRVGRAFLYRHGHRFLLSPERLQVAERYYSRHGGKTVFFGRFAPVVRSVGPMLAGVSHMRYPRFLAWDALGSVLWAVGHTILGYFVGAQYERFKPYLDAGGLALLALLGLLVWGSVWWHRRRQRAQLEPDTDENKSDEPSG